MQKSTLPRPHESPPETLTHYTTVDALVLILKGRRIKFSPLSKLDDPSEAKTGDQINYSDYCFISSWTAAGESIPMWRMYSDIERGVRIQLPKNPFKTYEHSPQDDGRFIFPAPLQNNPKVHCYISRLDELLIRVEPTLDKQKLYPKVISKNKVDISALGAYKHQCWEFVDEWRYRYLVVPTHYFLDEDGFRTELEQGRLYESVPKEYLYLDLTDEALDHLEITLAPQISPSAEEIVSLAVDRYAKNAKVVASTLGDYVRKRGAI